MIRARLLKNQVVRPDYTINDRWVPWNGEDPLEIHSFAELLEAAAKGKVEIEGRVLCADPKGHKLVHRRMDQRAILEASKRTPPKRLREALDRFAYDMDDSIGGGGTIGQEVIPLLGGPFNKQLYYHDYLRMHALCFYAYHNDPVARAIVNITRDFVYGRGFSVQCEDAAAQALWDAFARVNDIGRMFDFVTRESSVYGETMIWWLPQNETKIAYRVQPGQEPPKGLLPRIRLIDPSVVWEIVTYPEDITRVLSYRWVAPTQYQMYSGKDAGKSVPGIKFIYQDIPADQVMHFRLNGMSNEKRGRSDLFPVLGYLKQLRDSVAYMLVDQQKRSAWAIDTTVEGSQADVDRYVSEMAQLGTIPTAGSEFVHTAKIKREYLSNAFASKGGMSEGFERVMDLIAAGVQIPVSYFGFMNAAGQTRASALVATEPVSKKFQMRQDWLRGVVQAVAERLFQQFGIQSKFEITFPELIVQDRSTKLRDLLLLQQSGIFSRERVAEIAAQEFSLGEFDWNAEKAKIEEESRSLAPDAGLSLSPLSSPGSVDTGTGVTSDERRELSAQYRQ